MALDILSDHSKALLDDMVVDIVHVREQLKQLSVSIDNMALLQATALRQGNEEVAQHIGKVKEALTAMAREYVGDLRKVADSQLEGMTKANQNAVSVLNRHVAQLRADAAGAIANDVLVKLAEDRSQLVALTNSFGPKLESYTGQVGKLSENLAGLAGGLEQKVKGAYGVAEESLGLAIERKLTGVVWGYVAGAASIGALVASLVHVVLK